ncbi:MAG: hypothetical protein K6F61_08560 [Clostridiales bacterium]|nr:hypothetical protein [Clostridiales bacterium]
MTDARKTRRLLLCIYFGALAYFVLKLLYYALCIGGTPDEILHIGYIAELTRNPVLIPDFASMPMYQILSETAMRQVIVPAEGTVNYLGHPPLYYLLLMLAHAVDFRADETVLVQVFRLRFINILITSAAVALAFRVGYKKLGNRSPVRHLLFAAAVATLPELGYIASGVTNDNLSFLAFALFFTGVVRYDEGKTDLRTYGLIGIGFLLGSFSKLTTALALLIMLLAILVLDIIRTKSLKLILSRNFLIILPCFLLFLVYELLIRSRYGAWQPSLANLAPDFYRRTVFYVAPENRVPLTFFQYLLKFLGGIGHSWSSAYSDPGSFVSAAMHNGAAGLVYWVPVATSMAAAAAQAVRRKTDGYTVPAVLAFLGTLAWHFFTGWSGFQQSGYTGGAQARYYLFLIIAFALVFSEQAPALFRSSRAKRTGTALAVLLVILWLAGDAPRMLFSAGFPALT